MDASTKLAVVTVATLVAPGAVVLLIAKTAGASWLLSSIFGVGAVAATAALSGGKAATITAHR